MKKLEFLNEIYEAERIVKSANSVIGYIGDTEVFAMRGISDFSDYNLLEGATYDAPHVNPSLAELIQKDLDNKEAIVSLLELSLGGL